MKKALVTVIMGSKSDWPIMENACLTLDSLGVPNEARALSAHRTPDALFEYLKQSESDGVEVVIAGAGGAAHLPGVVAGKTLLPVIGVPIQIKALNGLDSLLSIAQMPGGIPVATMAIDKPGAINAGLFAASILSVKYPEFRTAIRDYRLKKANAILEDSILKGVEHA